MRPKAVALTAALAMLGGCATPPPPIAGRQAPQVRQMHCAAACTQAEWIAFLKRKKLRELAAPAGGRAYRILWVDHGAGDGRAPTIGYIEALLAADGSGRLSSCWGDEAVAITAAEIAPFETALRGSVFAFMPAQDPSQVARGEHPVEHVLETAGADGYRFVHRVGGIQENDVYAAAYMLEELARARQVRKPPQDDLCH